jgi:hypothetical protein
MPPSPSGFSSLWFGPAMKPSSDIVALNLTVTDLLSNCAVFTGLYSTGVRRASCGSPESS